MGTVSSTTTKEEPEMIKITKQYANPSNGGQERVTREGDKFYVASNWGDGFSGNVLVSRNQMEICLRHTNAPADVCDAILSN